MTLRQLEVFLAIARAQGYRRAAEALHTSQPALSQHIRELERELGARLFDRLGRGIALTEAGRVLEERASASSRPWPTSARRSGSFRACSAALC